MGSKHVWESDESSTSFDVFLRTLGSSSDEVKVGEDINVVGEQLRVDFFKLSCNWLEKAGFFTGSAWLSSVNPNWRLGSAPKKPGPAEVAWLLAQPSYMSRCNTSPVEVDVKLVSINESNKEMQIISLGVYLDECDTVCSAKGEYCGSGESSSCETRMRGSGEGGTREGHSLASRVISWEDVLEFVIVGDRGACASLNCKRCSLADRQGEGRTDDGFLSIVSMAFMQE